MHDHAHTHTLVRGSQGIHLADSTAPLHTNRCTHTLTYPVVSFFSTELTINLTCRTQGTVGANITFRFFLSDQQASTQATTISFRKVCIAGGNTPPPAERGVSANVKQILYVVTGLVAGIVVLIIVIVVIYHWKVLAGILRRRSSHSDEEWVSHPHTFTPTQTRTL